MTTIKKTSEEIRAYSIDPAMLANAKALGANAGDAGDDDAPNEPTFIIREAVRRRIIQGDYRDGDIAAFRTAFRAVTQARFAQALGISVDTLQNWEQGRRQPDGSAKALLRLLARHPRLLMRDLLATPAG